MLQTDPEHLNANEHLRELCKRSIRDGFKTIETPVCVILYLYTSKDIDNNDKLIHDALETAGVILNDSQIVEKKTVIIRPSKRGEKEKLHIEVLPPCTESLSEALGILEYIEPVKTW